jgi:uncharacterized membrane protein YfcA
MSLYNPEIRSATCKNSGLPRMMTDPLFYAIAIPAVVSLGLAKGGFTGLGAVATPLVALYLPPLEAAALLLPILMCQDLIAVYFYRRDWDAWNLKVLLPGALIGIVFGGLMASHVSDDAVRIIAGGIGLAFVAHAWLSRANVKPHNATALGGFIWGSISGFTSFVIQGGGPAFQAHTLPQRMSKLTFVGTSTLFFCAVNAMKVPPYFMLNQFSWANFSTSLVLLPLAVVANFAGFWLVSRTPTALFYRIAYALLLVISLGLLWQGLT